MVQEGGAMARDDFHGTQEFDRQDYNVGQIIQAGDHMAVRTYSSEICGRRRGCPLGALNIKDNVQKYIWVPYRDCLIKVSTRDIWFIKAERDYVRVNDGANSYLLRARLKEMEDVGDGAMLRIHRSIIIARDQIRALRHVRGGCWVAVALNGREFPIGRSYLNGVRSALFGPPQISS